MLRILFFAVVMMMMAHSAFAQAVNPARQYEQQRNSQSPADGVWYVYDREGNLSKEEHYKTYRLDGDIKTFYPTGSIKAITPYVDGQRHGLEKAYYEKGGLMEENTYAFNNLEGESRHYYEEGPLEKEMNYKKSQLDGTLKIYYKNGSLKQVLTYNLGVVNGSLLNYDEEGRVVSEDIYSKGVLKAHKEYKKDAESLISKQKINAQKADDKMQKPAVPAAPPVPSK